jgi:hypothetical protein
MRFPEAAELLLRAFPSPDDGGSTAACTRHSGLKFWAFVVGAAPLPPDVEEFWRRLGFAVVQGYGLTETAPIVTLNHRSRRARVRSARRFQGVEIRIADDGEILVRGENVTSGYYVADQSPEPKAQSPETASSTAKGWLHTGDIGERDEQGRLFIKGRKKEMIVTPDGLNVFPEDVERVLDEQPGVRESAVVGAIRWRAGAGACRARHRARDRRRCSDSRRQRAAAGPSAHSHSITLARHRPAAHRGDTQTEAQRHPRLGASGWLSGWPHRPATPSSRCSPDSRTVVR